MKNIFLILLFIGSVAFGENSYFGGGGGGGVSTTLTSAHLLVGNSSNVATDVAASGDLSLANTGAFTIANSAVTNAKVSASAAIDFSKLATLDTGHILAGNGGTVTDVTVSGGATISSSGVVTLANASIIGAVLTGYSSGAGTVASTDTLLQAIQKLNGNIALKLGGTTGSTDNALLRADGTGTVTVQGSAVTMDDTGLVDFGNSGNSSGPGIKVAGAVLSTGNTNIRPAFYLANGGILQFYNNGSLFGAIDSGEIEFGNNSFAHGFYIDSVAATVDFGMLNNDGAFEMHVHAGTIRPLASDASGNLQIGVASLAQAATDGFAYLPRVLTGAPTGTPTSKSGYAAVVVENVGDQLCWYTSAWHCTVGL